MTLFNGDACKGKWFAIGFATAVFVAHFYWVFTHLDTFGTYNLKGMWITVDNFDVEINAPDSAFTRVFNRLLGWDGQWYYHIAENGYICPELPEFNNPFKCNVGFFPLVPALGHIIQLTGIDLIYALPLVSMLAWLGTLFFLFRLLENLPLSNRLLYLVLATSYPGLLYAFTPYSELLLTFFLVATIYFSRQLLLTPKLSTLGILCLICVLASLTKATGLICCLIPALFIVFSRHKPGKLLQATFISFPIICGLLGLGLFLIYSLYSFGDALIYFKYVSSGWHNAVSDSQFFNPLVIITSFKWNATYAVRVSNLIMLLYPALFILVLLLSLFLKAKAQDYWPILLISLAGYVFHTVVGAGPSSSHINLLRHMVPYIVPLLLALALINNRISSLAVRNSVNLLVVVLALAGVVTQHNLLILFSSGAWVS